MPSAEVFDFRPVSEADLPLLRDWLAVPHVRRWWGPRHFSAPACQIDLRVGGRYLFCMRAPDGQDTWTTGTYQEIVPPERLVYTDSFADQHGNVVPATHYGLGDDFPMEMVVTMTLEALGQERTRLTIRQAGHPEGAMRELASAGLNEALDKLAEALRAMGAEAGGEHGERS